MSNKFSNIEISDQQLAELSKIRELDIANEKKAGGYNEIKIHKKRPISTYKDNQTNSLFNELDAALSNQNNSKTCNIIETLIKKKNVDFSDKRRL